MTTASSPSNAPSRAMYSLPVWPSSAGVPRNTTFPGTAEGSSSASCARARKAPRPITAITLCPQPWPIPGSESYSERIARVGVEGSSRPASPAPWPWSAPWLSSAPWPSAPAGVPPAPADEGTPPPLSADRGVQAVDPQLGLDAVSGEHIDDRAGRAVLLEGDL